MAEKQQYNEKQITAYIAEKFKDNNAWFCTIDNETRQKLTLKFKQNYRNSLRGW